MRRGEGMCIFMGLFLWASVCLAQEEDSRVENTRAYASEVKVTARVSRKVVPQNETLILAIKVTWKGDLDRFEIEKVERPVLTNLEVVGNSSSNQVRQDSVMRAIKTFEYILRPQELGMAYIDGSIITYKDLETEEEHTLVTQRLDVRVTDPIIEGNNHVLILVASGLLVLGAVAAVSVTVVRRKRAKEADEKRRALEAVPVEERFLSELEACVNLNDVNAGEAFASLARVFKKYLSEKYRIPAMGLTTQEICHELNKLAVEDRSVRHAEEVLNSSDVAKFSGGQVERATLERAYTLVEDILRQNKSVADVSHSVSENSTTHC
ncbi:MAG: BatD family protein [bacterium]